MELAALLLLFFFSTFIVMTQGTTQFGKSLRSQFLLEPQYTSLNHGSYGSIPRALLPVLDELRLKSEVNPDRWLRREMFPVIEKNKRVVADLVHVDPQELVFVFNAMTGINTVARSLPLEAGDKILYVCIYTSLHTHIYARYEAHTFMQV